MPVSIPRPAPPSCHLSELCARLVQDGELARLAVTPATGARVNECFPNVTRLVQVRGGQPVYGWSLREPFPGVLLEAEAHALWAEPDGTLRDVTPPAAPFFAQTVFLRDPQMRYEGRQIPSVRVSMVDCHLVDSLIETEEAWFEMINRGDLAGQHGSIPMTAEMKRNRERADKLADMIVRKHLS